MSQDRTWNLFALKLAGKASAEEWAELQLLIECKPEIGIHLQALSNFWHQHSEYDRERIEKALKKIAEDYTAKESFSGVLNPLIDESAGKQRTAKKTPRLIMQASRRIKNFVSVVRNWIHGSSNSLPG